MPIAAVTVDFSGLLRAEAASAVCSAARATKIFAPVLRGDNRAHATEVGSSITPIASPSPAWEPLSMPANMAARLVYLRLLSPASMMARLMFATSGASIMPLHGIIFLEAPAADAVTMIELQGTGSVEWFAAGDLV